MLRELTAQRASGDWSLATQFQAVGSGYYMSLGKKETPTSAPPRWASSVRECAMLILKPFPSNTRLITLCSRCHHAEFIHGDKIEHGHEVGPCLFNRCKCWRFVLEQEPADRPTKRDEGARAARRVGPTHNELELRGPGVPLAAATKPVLPGTPG